jgi:uncharacterized damage-inducible protein DinB
MQLFCSYLFWILISKVSLKTISNVLLVIFNVNSFEKSNYMKEHLKDLQLYNQWANGVVVDALQNNEMPDKAIELMSHIINANMIWLDRLEGRVSGLEVWKVYEKGQLRELLKRSDIALMNFISKSSEEKLSDNIEYANSKGEKFSSGIIEILIHLNVHAAYHRGQIISLMKGKVSPLPYTDYIHYARKIKSI